MVVVVGGEEEGHNLQPRFPLKENEREVDKPKETQTGPHEEQPKNVAKGIRVKEGGWECEFCGDLQWPKNTQGRSCKKEPDDGMPSRWNAQEGDFSSMRDWVQPKKP